MKNETTRKLSPVSAACFVSGSTAPMILAPWSFTTYELVDGAGVTFGHSFPCVTSITGANQACTEWERKHFSVTTVSHKLTCLNPRSQRLN
jgi:hypothetical protein